MTDHDSDYCARCQEEAFRQRLGDELFDYLEELAEKEAQDERHINVQ
jgi:hypothetical protein